MKHSLPAKARLLPLLAVLIVAVACGSFGRKPIAPAFDIRLVPNNKDKVALVSKAVAAQAEQLAAHQVPVISNSLGKPVLLAVKSGKPAALTLFLIDEGRSLWMKEKDITAKPTLLYDTVIIKEGGALVGMRLESGEEKWRFNPSGWDYFGAAQEKDTVFVTMGIGGECRKVGKHRGKIVALGAADGMVRWERQTEGHCLGAPSAFGGYVFLPFDMQSVSILDGHSGIEETRILSLDDNFTFVASFREGVYYGSKGLYRFDANSFAGLKQSGFSLRIKANDPVLLTFANDKGEEVTLYRSKGGAPPGFEDKATPLGSWEMGQDRFVVMNTDGTFRVTNKKHELTTLQKKGCIFVGGEGKFSVEGKKVLFELVGSTYYEPPLGKIPGDPELYKDRISPVIGLSNARDKIRLVWNPVKSKEGETTGFEGNSLFLLYYRFIFSFNARTGALQWAYRSDLDIEDVALGPGGLFIADRKGDLTCLDQVTGHLKGRIPTGNMITSASFNVGEYVPKFPSIKETEESIREALLEMILDKDNRLVPIRQYALGFLAKIEEPEVTRDLLTIYMNKAVPEEIKTITRQKILERNSGASYIIEAMKFHYDYLNEVSPPPVGVVAQALVKMKAKEGVLPLLQHLMDHETPTPDLKEVAKAIFELGDESVVPTVSEYLVKYHADSAFKQDLDPLFMLAEVIHKFGGVNGEELLRKLQGDPKTVKALANHIKEIFDTAYQKAVAAKMEEAKKGQETKTEAAEVDSGKVYQSLTQGQVTKILDGYKEEFAPCVQAYVEKVSSTSQVRLKLILNNKGKIESLMTLPNDPTLSSCIMSALIKVKWPKIKQLKQTAQYVIQVGQKKKEESSWPPQPQPQPQPEQPQPQPQPQPEAEWLPVPQPQPLPQPPQPQPQPLPQPGEVQPQPEQPPQPGIEEYPDVLPEDMPDKKK
jgi:outer membrane protein assembly factor BamB